MVEKVSAKIRKFKVEDMDDILEIEGQAFPKTAYSREIFLSYARTFPDNFIVIQMDEDVVGYMIFDTGGHVHSTAVKAAYRRKGFGEMLFMHALKIVNRRLWLEVRSKNTGAIRFYKKLGMRVFGKIPNYYGSDDALIMVLNQKEG